MPPRTLLAVAFAIAATSCARRHDAARATKSADVAGCARPAPGAAVDCAVPGFAKRDFTLEVPASWDGRAPLPVIFAFHGGGGNKRSAASVTCPRGDLADASCLDAVAKRAGFAVVRPDGTGAAVLPNVRTWNSGGGVGKWTCTSGRACREHVDDLAYFDALTKEVARLVPVDPKRIHATGLSNGGAMSHRLACERARVVASIVSVGGGAQHAAAGGACASGVAVLEIHGTEDPCWGYEESDRACLQTDSGVKVGVRATMEGWRARNGCAPQPDEQALPDADPADGTRATLVRWRGCRAAVELLRIDGGGHTWPSGDPYLSEKKIGRVSRDVTSEVVVAFLRDHPRP